MKVLVLYSELGPYNVPVFREMVARFGAELHVVAWDQNRLKPYDPPALSGVTYHCRSALTPARILALYHEVTPSLVVVAGWMDRGYFPALRAARRQHVPVVAGFDDQWHGTLRQRVGSLVYRGYLSRFISHAWVAGPRQYEYARRLGFGKSAIIFDLLSADTDVFAPAGRDVATKAAAYPRVFLYVGNFRSVKGTDILLAAYAEYRERYGGDWTLHCVGNGELEGRVRAARAVRCDGYTAQADLVNQARAAGVFVLPSRHDQWGVVVHEFAAAGLPLLLSAQVGAADVFLVEGLNGHLYRPNTPGALAAAMHRFAQLSPERLVAMGEASVALSRRISPVTSAANVCALGDAAKARALPT